MNCGANGQNASGTQWKKLRVPITKTIAPGFVRKRGARGAPAVGFVTDCIGGNSHPEIRGVAR